MPDAVSLGLDNNLYLTVLQWESDVYVMDLER